jgi:hypothetical protein
MGSRDNHLIDDRRHDELLLSLLARSGQPAAAPSPADLVTRTLRQLPQEPPAIAGRAFARRARRRLVLRLMLVAALGLFGVLGIWSALGGGASLALMFGDGVSGLSRTLLTVELLAKPLLRIAGAGSGLWMLAGLLALVGIGWLWWQLLRRTPAIYAERVT